MKQYKLLKAKSSEELEELVNQHLQDKFKLEGNVVVSNTININNENVLIFVQAVTKNIVVKLSVSSMAL